MKENKLFLVFSTLLKKKINEVHKMIALYKDPKSVLMNGQYQKLKLSGFIIQKTSE